MSSPYGNDELIGADQILDDSDDDGWEDMTPEEAAAEVDADVAAGKARYMQPGEEEDNWNPNDEDADRIIFGDC